MAADEGDLPNNEARSDGPAVIGYAGLARGSAYEHWIEEVCRGLVKADAKPLGEGPVLYNMTMLALPQVSVALFEGSPIQFVARADDAARLFIQAPLHTPVRLSKKKRALDLGIAGIGLTDAAEVGAETIVHAKGRFRSIGIDRKALLAVCPNAEELVARELHLAPQLKAHICHYHEIALRNAPELDFVTRKLIGQHLIDLVSLALGAGRDERERATGRGLAAARLAAIKADIIDRLAETRLSIATVAARHGITPRYLNKLFEPEGVSFTEYVLGQRLACAHRKLCDPRSTHHPIGTIALSVGFNDLSYFNRCFRRRFGMTPSDVRQQTRQAGS